MKRILNDEVHQQPRRETEVEDGVDVEYKRQQGQHFYGSSSTNPILMGSATIAIMSAV